jgi:ABC-type nitrate/sulfonate/bicarbonate transport system permease component
MIFSLYEPKDLAALGIALGIAIGLAIGFAIGSSDLTFSAGGGITL